MRMSRRPFTEINVVPYIDVMLVLLIIFMVTFPLMQQSVSIQLPQGHGDPLSQSRVKPIILTVNRQGDMFLNFVEKPNQSLPSDQVKIYIMARLQHDQNKGLQSPILVHGDQDANYQHVMQAISTLSEAGATGIGLVTQPRVG